MRVRAWLLVAAVIALDFGFGAVYLVRQMRTSDTQSDASWLQAKYSSTPTAIELPIEVVGHEDGWRIRYPGIRRLQGNSQLAADFAEEASTGQGQADDVRLVNELHLWKGASVRIHLKSADVPHTFFVPVMRLKQDAEPGRVNSCWLQALESNVTWDDKFARWKCDDEWEFACVEHRRRGKMAGRLLVHETKDDFLRWLRQAQEGSVLPQGRQ